MVEDELGDADLLAPHVAEHVIEVLNVVYLLLDVGHGERREEPHGRLGPERRVHDKHTPKILLVAIYIYM